MSVKFDTYEYEFTHGTRPKGKGWWAFIPGTWRDNTEPVFINAFLTLADAKREVKFLHPEVKEWRVAP